MVWFIFAIQHMLKFLMSGMKITATLGQDKLLLLKITSLQLVFLIQLFFFIFNRVSQE